MPKVRQIWELLCKKHLVYNVLLFNSEKVDIMIRIPGSIPITIHPIFWIFAAFIGWISTGSQLTSVGIQYTFVWIGMIFISVLVHEYGHALTAMAFGQKAKIDLVAFGGATQRQGKKLRGWQEFVIVLMGPVAGLLLALAAMLMLPYVEDARWGVKYTVNIFFVMNVFWSVVNLLPVHPLDGGKLLSIVLGGAFGVRGIRVSFIIGIVAAALLALLFFLRSSFLVGSVFLLLAYESYRAWQEMRIVADADSNYLLQRLLMEIKQESDKEKAIHLCEKLRELSKSGLIYINATEYLAHLLSEQGRTQEAYSTLMEIKNTLSPPGVRLLHLLAFKEKHLEEAISLGNQVYKESPSFEIAVNNALACSLLGQIKPAIGWLQCAIRDGVPNRNELLQRKEFDPIRSNPLFQELHTNLEK